MWRILLRTVRAHPGQLAVLGLLGALLAVVAAAAPAYTRLATADLRSAQLSGALPLERVVSVRGSVPVTPTGDGGRVERLQRRIETAAEGTGLTLVLTRELSVHLGAPTAAETDRGLVTALISREGACARVVLSGACPAGPGQVALGAATAGALGLRIGDTVHASVSTGVGPREHALRITATYTARPGAEAYWASRPDLADDPRRLDPPALTDAATFAVLATSGTDFGAAESADDQEPTTSTTVTADLLALDPAALPADLTAVATRAEELRSTPPDGFTTITRLPDLLHRVTENQHALVAGLTATAGELLLIGAFVLLVAARSASAQRLPRTTLALLRGAPPFSRWWFAAAGPVLATMLAAAAGALAGRALVRAPVTPVDLAVAGAAVLLPAIAVGVVEAHALRTPILNALRATRSARSGRALQPLDGIVAAGAAVMIYQLAVGVPDRGITPLAPGLLLLAFALLLGRLLTTATVGIGGHQLRRGALAPGLAAAQLARGSVAPRLLALLIVAVALFATAASGYRTTSAALLDRARLELGADRVLVVTGMPYTAVRDAVRAADPQGRYAMAATRDTIGAHAVLAVDSARLAAVAGWDAPAGQPDAATVAGLLRPPVNPAVTVTGTELLLDVTVTERLGIATPVELQLVKADGTLVPVRLLVGPEPGTRTYRAAVSGCSGGCRVAYLRFEFSPDALRIERIAQSGPEQVLLDGAALASPGRWRSGFTTAPGEITVRHGTGWLSATYVPDDPRHISTDLRVLLADAPVPLPIVAAGRPSIAQTDEVTDLPVLAIDDRPVHVVATTPGLPGAGADGYLMDYEYADRLAAEPLGRAGTEVWTTADTPPQILADLRERLTVLREETVADRADRMLRDGPGRAALLRLAATGLGLLLAAGGLLITAVAEHRRWVRELLALRVQGVSGRVAHRSVHLYYALLTGTAVLAGVALAIAAAPQARRTAPVFVDAWSATGVPVGSGVWGALAAAAVAAVLLAGLAGLVARAHLRRLATATAGVR
ncbi:hypothetical protein F4553_007171 [Allocatelliglobosispora scoriae]|uniref:FtsX-like permease family protein n=2 Tax=Allocatelliglobosispora scoriae TaxID=643052 RepID=A0A841BX67_9ACTN|nr:hypothetical protein [Allocatelliglobosispora scoriae]